MIKTTYGRVLTNRAFHKWENAFFYFPINGKVLLFKVSFEKRSGSRAIMESVSRLRQPRY
jgi:hypothetical protein